MTFKVSVWFVCTFIYEYVETGANFDVHDVMYMQDKKKIFAEKKAREK